MAICRCLPRYTYREICIEGVNIVPGMAAIEIAESRSKEPVIALMTLEYHALCREARGGIKRVVTCAPFEMYLVHICSRNARGDSSTCDRGIRENHVSILTKIDFVRSTSTIWNDGYSSPLPSNRCIITRPTQEISILDSTQATVLVCSLAVCRVLPCGAWTKRMRGRATDFPAI